MRFVARGKHSGVSGKISLLLFDQVKLHASESIIKQRSLLQLYLACLATTVQNFALSLNVPIHGWKIYRGYENFASETNLYEISPNLNFKSPRDLRVSKVGITQITETQRGDCEIMRYNGGSALFITSTVDKINRTIYSYPMH